MAWVRVWPRTDRKARTSPRVCQLNAERGNGGGISDVYIKHLQQLSGRIYLDNITDCTHKHVAVAMDLLPKHKLDGGRYEDERKRVDKGRVTV